MSTILMRTKVRLDSFQRLLSYLTANYGLLRSYPCLFHVCRSRRMPATARNLLTRFHNPIFVHRPLRKTDQDSRPARIMLSAWTRRPASVVAIRDQVNRKQLVDASYTEVSESPSKTRGKNAPSLVWRPRISSWIFWARCAV